MRHPVEKLIKKPITRNDYASEQGSTNPQFSMIDCGLGHSPLGFPKTVEAALRKITPQLLNEYPTDPYARTLAEDVRNRFGLDNKTHVYFNGAGSYGLLASVLSDLVSQDAVRSGAKVIGYGPQFTNIALLADRAQIPYTSVQPELNTVVDEKIDALTQHRRKNRTGAIVYVDNPNNPTGDAADVDTIVRLLEATKGKDLVIVDEAYGDMVIDSNSAIPLVEQYPHLVVLRSVSKGIGLASPRLGYAVMSQPVGEIYKNFELVFSVDAVTHLLGQAALNPNVLAKFLPAVRARTRQLKADFIAVLQKHDIAVYPTYSDVSILMAQGPAKFYTKLLEYGVSTEDGGTFKPTHKQMNDSFVRFRIPGNERDIQELDRRLNLMKRR